MWLTVALLIACVATGRFVSMTDYRDAVEFVAEPMLIFMLIGQLIAGQARDGALQLALDALPGSPFLLDLPLSAAARLRGREPASLYAVPGNRCHARGRHHRGSVFVPPAERPFLRLRERVT